VAAAIAGDVSNTGKRNFAVEENQARTLVSRVSISQLKRFLLLLQAQGFISLSLTHTDPSRPVMKMIPLFTLRCYLFV